MISGKIDELKFGLENGALGGKLIGAGGGGFLMFYADENAKSRHAMRGVGLQEVVLSSILRARSRSFGIS